VPLHGCDGCGTVWRADPDLWRSADEDYEHDTYDVQMLQELHRDEVRVAQQDERWLTAQGVAPGRRLLEVACYVGGFLTFARHQGAEATGVDPNPQLVRWCRALRLDARCGFVERIDWHGATFDGVWILNCFDQVAAPGELLDAARRLARPGGRLVIRTPNAAFIRAAYGGSSRLEVAAREHALWGVPHLCCYTVGALSALVQRRGFSVTEVRARPTDHRLPEAGVAPPWFDLVAVAGPHARPVTTARSR
jgi:SAM-dependent methyltransferase